MRVVFDTNILVSALVFPGGHAEVALERIISGADQLLISRAIRDELLSVLARKFSRDREELARVAVWLSELAVEVRPEIRIHVVADEADNRILECAIAGKAPQIVTGDKELLRLAQYEDVKIVTLRQYLS